MLSFRDFFNRGRGSQPSTLLGGQLSHSYHTYGMSYIWYVTYHLTFSCYFSFILVQRLEILFECISMTLWTFHLCFYVCSYKSWLKKTFNVASSAHFSLPCIFSWISPFSTTLFITIFKLLCEHKIDISIDNSLYRVNSINKRDGLCIPVRQLSVCI